MSNMQNTLAAEALAGRREYASGERSVRTTDGNATLWLHQDPVMLHTRTGEVHLFGNKIIPTRKTARCVNAALKALSLGRIFSRAGALTYETPDGQQQPLSGKTLVLSCNRD